MFNVDFYFNYIRKVRLSVIFIIECKDSLKTTHIQQSLIIISVNLSISLDYEVKINYFCINKWVNEL